LLQRDKVDLVELEKKKLIDSIKNLIVVKSKNAKDKDKESV